jgi:MAM domain, meprin/A5/mu
LPSSQRLSLATKPIRASWLSNDETRLGPQEKHMIRTMIKSLACLAAATTLAWAQAPVAAPYLENFDTQTACTLSPTVACPLTNGFIQDPNDAGDWVVDSGGTGSLNTGPSVDHTTGTATGNYLYTETSGAVVGSERRLISPVLDLLSAANPQASFWYHMFGATMGTLHVDLIQQINAATDGVSVPGGGGNGTLTSGVSMFTAGMAGDTITVSGSTTGNDGVYTIVSVIDDFTVTVTPDFATTEANLSYSHERLIFDVVPSFTDNLDLWQKQSIPIVPVIQAPGNAFAARIQIRGVSGTSFTSDMAIDDFAFVDAQPNDIGVNSIDTPGSTAICAGSYSIAATVENFGTNPQVNIPITLILDGNTVAADVIPGPVNGGTSLQHVFSLPAVIPVGTSTLDVVASLPNDAVPANDLASKTVVASAAVTTYPYLADFESGTSGWAPGGGTTTWNFGFPIASVINTSASGFFCFGTNTSGSHQNNEDGFVRSPCFDFSNLSNPFVSLNIWWECDFSNDGMNLQASTDGGATWVTIGTVGDDTNWYNDNTILAAPGGSQEGWTGRSATGNGSGGWVLATHELSAFAGASQVEFRVNFSSGPSIFDEGVAFDDFRIFEPVLPFPGSGEDLRISTGVGGTAPSSAPGSETKVATFGDQVTIVTESVQSTYVGAPYALVADLFNTAGGPPTPISPMFPEAHIGSNAVVVVDGNNPASSAGLPFVVAPQGSALDFFFLDPFLVGNSVLLQSLVLDPAATNGFFAISDGFVIEFQ